MTVIDLLVVGTVAWLFVAFYRLDALRFRGKTLLAPKLVLAGLACIALFHSADLVLMLFLPTLIGEAAAAEWMTRLHLDVRWLITLAALSLLCTGFILELMSRKASEEALEASESRFRGFVENTSDWVWEVDRDVRSTYSNRQVEQLLGYTPAEIAELTLEDLVHPEDCAKIRAWLPELMSQGRGWKQWLVRTRHRDGSYRYLESTADPVRDVNGDVTGFRGIDRDATFQTLISRISADFVGRLADDLGARIERALGQIGVCYGLDRISFWRLDGKLMQRNHEWAREGMDGPRDLIAIKDRLPWAGALLRERQAVRIECLDDLPGGAADRQFVEGQGIKSMLAVPLLEDGALIGVAVFSTVSAPRKWPEAIESELRLLAEKIAAAHAQAEAVKASQRRAHELTLALAEIEQLKNRLEAENVELREEIRSAHEFEQIVGDSAALRHCLDVVAKAAPSDAAILILGETGTGKELIAKAIHELSSRRGERLVTVNCSALPVDLVESELFGHERGAFTGAHRRRKGRFEAAHGGTLFLDEIAELPPHLQAKLLRVLQDGGYEPVGGTETLYADVRLIAATNRDLDQAVASGQFRSDLYYRINTIPIRLPPLRERREDIAQLAQHFVDKHGARLGKSVEYISTRMLLYLQERDWPGNVRELEHFIERALIAATGPVLSLGDSEAVDASSTVPSSVRPVVAGTDLRAVEREHILHVLEAAEWTIGGNRGAAARLGLPPSTLRSKMKKLGIQRAQ